jgi:hypothetical protein
MPGREPGVRPTGPGPGGGRRPASLPAGHAEDWRQWWQAAAADPTLADAAAARERGTVHHHGPEGAQLAVHTAALRAAGFAEIGTLWQRGSNRLLAAIR